MFYFKRLVVDVVFMMLEFLEAVCNPTPPNPKLVCESIRTQQLDL